VQFRADSDGYITGISFLQECANTGTHLGNLWNTSGALLASATFTSESASGWQQVNFSNPVAITANTAYVAPPHHSRAFSMDQNYFATSGVDSTPLHALPNVGPAATECTHLPIPALFPQMRTLFELLVDVVFNYNAGRLPLSVSTVSLPNGTQSCRITELVAVGGTAPYSWSLPSGMLPSG